MKKPKEVVHIKNYAKNASTVNPIRNKWAPQTPSRILLCGPSGCGKTNFLLNLIYDLLPWSCLHIYAKDLEEENYKVLKEACGKVKEDEEDFKFVFDTKDLISVDDLDPKEHNLIVFDDFITEKDEMPKIIDLFIRGRKKNATVIFLTQSYFSTPKDIRLNCNYFCIWRLNDSRELEELYRNHMCCKSLALFRDIFNKATNDKHSFLMIDNNTDRITHRLRKNISGLILPR